MRVENAGDRMCAKLAGEKCGRGLSANSQCSNPCHSRSPGRPRQARRRGVTTAGGRARRGDSGRAEDMAGETIHGRCVCISQARGKAVDGPGYPPMRQCSCHDRPSRLSPDAVDQSRFTTPLSTHRSFPGRGAGVVTSLLATAPQTSRRFLRTSYGCPRLASPAPQPRAIVIYASEATVPPQANQ